MNHYNCEAYNMDTDNMSTEISKRFQDNITIFARFKDQLDQTEKSHRKSSNYLSVQLKYFVGQFYSLFC